MWSAAQPKRDGGVRYHFVCYVRQTPKGKAEQEEGPLEEVRFPAGMASRHDEMQVGGCCGCRC